MLESPRADTAWYPMPLMRLRQVHRYEYEFAECPRLKQLLRGFHPGGISHTAHPEILEDAIAQRVTVGFLRWGSATPSGSNAACEAVSDESPRYQQMWSEAVGPHL